MNNLLFVGFSCIFLLWILIFKGLTARRLYKSFGVKGLNRLREQTELDGSWRLGSLEHPYSHNKLAGFPLLIIIF
jgi:hypothetical protein